MSEEVETVNIKANTEGGHVRINKSDFDPAKHELWDPVPPPALPLPPV